MSPAQMYPDRVSPGAPPGLLPVRQLVGANTEQDEMTLLWTRVERARETDREKSELLSDLMQRYQIVYDSWASLVHEKHQYQTQLRSWRVATERNPFVIVLIDGDGMIFQDTYIQKGEDGGRLAAAQLQAAILHFLEVEVNHLPLEARIVCRIYANVKGLAETLVRVGVITESRLFEEFVLGFVRSKVLFDFVDVGPGKDRTDQKIIETFKLSIDDLHCRQILFGCSHDNRFARVLEEYMAEDYSTKVTLLEGVPFEKELSSLPFRKQKLHDLFRGSKLVVPKASYSTNPAYVETVPKNFNAIPGLPTRLPPPRNGNWPQDSPSYAKVVLANSPTPSNATLGSDGVSVGSRRVMNWAETAVAPPLPASPAADYRPADRNEIVARNRAGQRIDPPYRDIDKAEVDRVKKLKLCNVHYLLNECPYGNKCPHRHNYQPTEGEIAALRLVARLAPCTNGSGCEVPKCVYGHCCPAAPAKTKPTVKGIQTCTYGSACNFPPELHDIDRNMVKTLVIR